MAVADTPKKEIPATLRPETKAVLDAVTQRTGLKQIELLARVVGWFGSADAAFQNAIVAGSDPVEEIWRIRQGEKLTRGEGTMGIKDIPAAAQQLRELADRIEIFDRARRPRGK